MHPRNHPMYTGEWQTYHAFEAHQRRRLLAVHRASERNMPTVHVDDISPERVGGLFRHEEVIVPRTGKKYPRLTAGSGGAVCRYAYFICDKGYLNHTEPCTP